MRPVMFMLDSELWRRKKRDNDSVLDLFLLNIVLLPVLGHNAFCKRMLH